MIVNSQDDTCLVFNLRPGKLAMLCICKTVTSSQLIEAMPFAGALGYPHESCGSPTTILADLVNGISPLSHVIFA